MKIFGHFETDSDSRHSLHEESEKSIQNKEDKEDDLRRKYLNEPSANQTQSDHEILVKHSKPQKQTTFVGYLRDMFKFKSKERHRLERDVDGYVKKLYSEVDDSFPKSDETTNLMTYIEFDSEFLGSKPKQLEASGDEKEGRRNFGDKIQKLLAKVIAHHGNEWFQELDDANNESGDTKRHKIIKSISNVSLEVDEEDDSIKNELDGKLLAKNQHRSEWFHDMGERGDTNLEQREKQAEGFLKQLLKTKEPAKEEGAKFKGLQISEVILSYLTNPLDMKLNNPQEEMKTDKQRKNNFMVIAYLTKVFGMRSEKFEDAENVQVKSEDPVTLSEDSEQVKVPQLKNEYDAKIRTYLHGLFKSKSESDVSLVKSPPFLEESAEIVTTATDFEGEAGAEVSGIVENEIISYDGDVGQETKSFDCNEENLLQADQIAPSKGLIKCAMDVVKLFSKRNYPPEKGELAISRAIEEEDYIESADEEDEFEEALDQYSDEEYSLTKPINLKSLATDVIPSGLRFKRGSILHKIYTSGYQHILPHSIEENSLLHQCRQFLSSPNITSLNFVTEPYVNVEEDDTKNSTVNSVSKNSKNEDVFEDAQDFLSDKVKEGKF